MSQENIELYRRLHEALNEREAPEALIAEDFLMENISTAVTGRTYFGAAGWRAGRSDLFEVFDEGASFVVEEIIADGDDFVVGRVALVGTGALSGAPLDLRWISVGWFPDGKATRTVGYASRREALAGVAQAF
jgi:ketosteroid isomerase-like protein